MNEDNFWIPWRPRCRLRQRVPDESSTKPRDAAEASLSKGHGIRVPAEASAFCSESLGIRLDAWQARFVDAGAKRKVLLGSRQCGKSMAVAALAVHRMLKRADYQIVVVTASERQSALFLDKCKWMLRKLGLARVAGDGANAHSVRLENGSRIVGLPCAAPTIRGFTADLLVMDEAAWIPDVVYAAARPMLAATAGDLVVMSSAYEPVGFFWELTTEKAAADGWVQTVAPATAVPRFTPEFLAEERKALGEANYSREYECKFADSGRGIFDRKLVESAMTDEVEPLFGGGSPRRGPGRGG